MTALLDMKWSTTSNVQSPRRCRRQSNVNSSALDAPMHVHEVDDELFCILDEELGVVGHEGKKRIGRRDYVKSPCGVPHGVRNVGDAQMNGIAKQAAFYRGYLADERSLVPVTIILATVVVLWLVVYFVGAVSGALQDGAWFQSAEGSCALAINTEVTAHAGSGGIAASNRCGAN